jgi:hypothetical protein
MSYVGRKSGRAALISADIPSNLNLLGDYVKIPSATTTERDALTPAVGMLLYNTTLGIMQQYAASGWASIDSPPTVSSLNYPGDDTALDIVGEFNLTCTTQSSTTVLASSTTGIVVGQVVKGTGIPTSPVPTVESIITNTSFVLSGAATASASVTLTFNTQTLVITGTNFSAGATVTIDGTAPSTVTRNSSSQITVTGTPAKTAGTKVDGLVVSNTSGLSASINVDYSPLPGWSSPASGNLLNDYTGTITEIALTGGADTTSYAITTGALPAGLTIGSGDGDINGNMTASAATYNFTVTATDAQAQSSPRLFNIISKGVEPATGGTITTYTGFRVHTFLLANTGQSFTPASSFNVDWLVVGGGGGGGAVYSGGGGAGGFRTGSSFGVTATGYTITVGAGGAASTNGGGSTFASYTSAGGGTGGSWGGPNGGTGGSGGGGTGYSSSWGAGNTPSTSPSQGRGGGAGYDGGAIIVGGGGGGASAGGYDGGAGGSPAGNGGAGTANSYRTGSSVTYAGGGGGGASPSASVAGAGGAGGGGAGGHGASDDAVAGTANTGGGGGGVYVNTGASAGIIGVGGSGIVVIRYAV